MGTIGIADEDLRTFRKVGADGTHRAWGTDSGDRNEEAGKQTEK